MSWLTPLGFLGLIGIAVLVLIYILKPNFQQKIISSTFVWKLSLKYRKKRLPINRWRNLLLFLCQVLIITSCALILAQPVVKADDPENYTEKIAIIDASGSMLSEYDNETRFERAVKQVKELSGEMALEDGYMTVIVAGKEAYTLVQRSGVSDAELLSELYAKLDDLVKPDDMKCTYGAGDIDGAMKLAEPVLAENPKSEVLLYTGNKYIDEGDVVTVVDISAGIPEGGEWNAAILDVKAENVENYYEFTVEMAVYNTDTSLMVYCDIHNPNGEGGKREWIQPIEFINDEKVTFTFNAESMGYDPESGKPNPGIYSYDRVEVHFDRNLNDSIGDDNNFQLYGGEKHVLKIQYASSLSNTFFSSAFMAVRDSLSDRWDIELDEVTNGKEFVTSGYDLYIFEHDAMPMAEMPTDGAVILVDPQKAPPAAGFTLGGDVSNLTQGFYLAPGLSHSITEGLTIENIWVTKYTRITSFDMDEFKPLIYCGGDPILIVKNEPLEKLAVLTIDINYSDLALLIEFPQLVYRLFNYFLPSTITEFAFDVDETVSLNARGESISITGPGIEEKAENFPYEFTVSVPGIYTLTQKLMSGTTVVDNFYVKISEEQSNIAKTYDELVNPYIEELPEPDDWDLLIYFATALTALVFIEWLLQSRDM